MNKKVFITMEDTKMGISGITSGYPMGYKTKRAVNNISGKGFDNTAINGTDDLTAKRLSLHFSLAEEDGEEEISVSDFVDDLLGA